MLGLLLENDMQRAPPKSVQIIFWSQKVRTGTYAKTVFQFFF